eukprot:scaffold250170_cov19-Prasinocladus_malaysianus.AAC.1
MAKPTASNEETLGGYFICFKSNLFEYRYPVTDTTIDLAPAIIYLDASASEVQKLTPNIYQTISHNLTTTKILTTALVLKLTSSEIINQSNKKQFSRSSCTQHQPLHG